MNRLAVIRELFASKQKILSGYKKTYPNVGSVDANISIVTNTVKVSIVNADDEEISNLTVSEARHYASLGE
jgi:hypothetical protein